MTVHSGRTVAEPPESDRYMMLANPSRRRWLSAVTAFIPGRSPGTVDWGAVLSSAENVRTITAAATRPSTHAAVFDSVVMRQSPPGHLLVSGPPRHVT